MNRLFSMLTNSFDMLADGVVKYKLPIIIVFFFAVRRVFKRN